MDIYIGTCYGTEDGTQSFFCKHYITFYDQNYCKKTQKCSKFTCCVYTYTADMTVVAISIKFHLKILSVNRTF